MIDNYQKKQIIFSVIVPAYNEEMGIDNVIKNIKNFIDQRYEIIVVNDGSTDQTLNILEQINDIKIITHYKNMGYGAALKSGVKQAKGKYVLIIDADASYPAETIPQFTQYTDFDMVVGARVNSNVSIPFFRRPAKWLIGKLANHLTNTEIPDLNSGLRIIKKNALKKFLHLLPNGFSFTSTLSIALIINGYRVKYLPINYYKRQGESKIKPVQDTLNFFQLIIRTILFFSPLKIFIPASLLLLLASIAVFIYSYFFTPQVMDVTIIILFVFFLQMLALGLLADLIIKMKNQK